MSCLTMAHRPAPWLRYAVTKHALDGLADMLRLELDDLGVKVSHAVKHRELGNFTRPGW